MSENKHHFERIVGGSETDKQTVSIKLQEVFDYKSDSFKEYEQEKSPEDLEIIGVVEALADQMVTEYGGKIKSIPIDHIHIFNLGSVLKMTQGRVSGGICRPMGSEIGVEKGKSKLGFASTIAHELFHLKSPKVAWIGESADNFRLYRSGLQMFDMKDTDKKLGEEKNYFGELEEAIVAECAKKLLNRLSGESIFKEETEAIKKLSGWIIGFYRLRGLSEEQINQFEMELKYIHDAPDRVKEVLAFSDDERKRQAYAAGMFESLLRNKQVDTVERYHERKKFYDLLDKLVADSNGKFKSRDQMFDEFAKANFNGNYLPLARIVEGIMGKGSFRKLAEEFSEEPEKT